MPQYGPCVKRLAYMRKYLTRAPVLMFVLQVMVANFGPADYNADESLSTLRCVRRPRSKGGELYYNLSTTFARSPHIDLKNLVDPRPSPLRPFPTHFHLRP